jgi:hypothetical protein
VSVHDLHQTYHRLQNSFWTHPIKLLGEVGHKECCFGLSGDIVSVGAR